MQKQQENVVTINDSTPLDYSNMQVNEFPELLLEIPRQGVNIYIKELEKKEEMQKKMLTVINKSQV